MHLISLELRSQVFKSNSKIDATACRSIAAAPSIEPTRAMVEVSICDNGNKIELRMPREPPGDCESRFWSGRFVPKK